MNGNSHGSSLRSCLVNWHEFESKSPITTDTISDAQKIVQCCKLDNSTAYDCKPVLKGGIL